MKRLFILTPVFCAIGIAHAQYFDGTHPGVPLLGKNGPLDGGAITNVATTNLVGSLPSQTNSVAFTNDTTWFESKGAYTGITNSAANVTGVVFTRTNGAFVTNNIVNGVIK